MCVYVDSHLRIQFDLTGFFREGDCDGLHVYMYAVSLDSNFSVTCLKYINDVTYQLLHGMHPCINTAINTGDIGLFSSGSDMIHISDDDVL